MGEGVLPAKQLWSSPYSGTQELTCEASTQDGDTWTQQMVMGRLHRAALCVEWAPNGNKFAIGSGTYNCCVCSYEEENKWWAGRVIRKAHNSSVVSVAWHPDSIKLATGSTDGYCRVFHACTAGMRLSSCHCTCMPTPDSSSVCVFKVKVFCL